MKKQEIYLLIQKYLSKKITPKIFCDEYYRCYDLELDLDLLTDLEKILFAELSIVTSRFSHFKEDIDALPNVYFTEEDLNKKIIEVDKRLKKTPGYKSDDVPKIVGR